MTQSPVAPCSRRGRRAHKERILTHLEQIRVPPAGVQGAWAYYLRPDGATILDALILYPNGGVPDIPENPRLAARYGVNAAYYRERQRAKGFEYLGQTLTEGGMKKVVEVLKENAEDEILFVEDEIARCQHDIETADDPKWRDNQRKRMGQFKRRLHYLKEELDPDRMEEELREIARAQALSVTVIIEGEHYIAPPTRDQDQRGFR